MTRDVPGSRCCGVQPRRDCDEGGHRGGGPGANLVGGDAWCDEQDTNEPRTTAWPALARWPRAAPSDSCNTSASCLQLPTARLGPWVTT
eukprot:scaffold4369_cov336-Prasinococcus_capsulatus_cf.AAC.4